MTSVLECSYLRRRLRELEEIYPEPNILDQCDCTSYSYIGLSVMLLSVGSYISVLALGNIDGYLFSNLGHMWLVGPIFICSGLMIAVKSFLYLRRKILNKMICRQRALLRGFHHLTERTDQFPTENFVSENFQLSPPAYEVLIGNQSYTGKLTDPTLPSYEEAVFLSTRKMIIKSDKNSKLPSTSQDNFEDIVKEDRQQQQLELMETNILP